MRPGGVVLVSPPGEGSAGIGQRRKPVLAPAFIAQPAVKAPGEATLDRLAWPDNGLVAAWQVRKGSAGRFPEAGPQAGNHLDQGSGRQGLASAVGASSPGG